MKFLILGATGASGIEFVRKTLEVYPDASIVIYARSPSKLPEDLLTHPSITAIQGQLEEIDKVEAALTGAIGVDGTGADGNGGGVPVDVVLSALGPSSSQPPDTPLARFHAALLPLMHKHHIKRGLFLSTASHSDPHDKWDWKFAALVKGVKTLYPNAYREIVETSRVVVESGEELDLDYTLVRVPVLTNGSEGNGAVAGYIGDGRVGTMLSRKAFAAFVVGEVGAREWVKKAPMISNA